MIGGLKYFCEDRVRELGAGQPRKEKAPARPYSTSLYLDGVYKKDGDGLFARVCSDRTGSGLSTERE